MPLYRLASLAKDCTNHHKALSPTAAAVPISGWSCFSSDCITSESQGILTHADCSLMLSHKQVHTCTYIRTYIHTYIDDVVGIHMYMHIYYVCRYLGGRYSRLQIDISRFCSTHSHALVFLLSLKLQPWNLCPRGLGKQTGEKGKADKNKILIRSIILDSLSYLNCF